MKVIMNLNALKNTEELQSFLNRSQALAFSLSGKKAGAPPYLMKYLGLLSPNIHSHAERII